MRRIISSTTLCITLAGLTFPLVSGCAGGSDLPLGRVSGQVTLDGEPLSGASVKFTPVGDGRGSFGSTDASGMYSLEYTYEKSGALVGEHLVVINSAEKDDESIKDPVVPEQYNTKFELKADVKPGKNRYDFKLNSQ